MADSAVLASASGAVSKAARAVRHSALVRVTHWITAAAFVALLVSGVEIVISHPRFYWGEDGSVTTPALFQLPIPASRPFVETGYGYVLPDQNGWSRSMHFQAAWAVGLTGLLYVAWGLVFGHFRRNMSPARGVVGDAWSYNFAQRVTYLVVIFGLFPLMVWTGLAMAPAATAACPWLVTVWGGQQSARTIHFFAAGALAVFALGHVVMVWRAGFVSRVRAMVTGR